MGFIEDELAEQRNTIRRVAAGREPEPEAAVSSLTSVPPEPVAPEPIIERTEEASATLTPQPELPETSEDGERDVSPIPALASDQAVPAVKQEVAPGPPPESPPEPLPSFVEEEVGVEAELHGLRRALFNFEELFGRRLPIWAGGITLAVAGVLIVRYAMDIGFFARVFTPGVQAVCGMLFGFGLIAGAEWAWRNKNKVQDPRVSQALSGAGISTLYAALLVAANIYGLISPLTAFWGFAFVTAAALWLSLHHGVPSALLGLAGGLAAPALTVGMDADVPMLAVYLAFIIGGLVGVSRIQRWPWLAIIALAGGAGWSLWLVLAGQALSAMGTLSVGTFILLLAIAMPLFPLRDGGAILLRSIAAIIGAVQLAMLVAMGGYQPLEWGLFALIAAAGQWLAWRNGDFAIVPTLGAALSVLLLLLWPEPAGAWLAAIGLALAAIHALPLLPRLWRDPVRKHGSLELSAIAVAIPLVVLRHFHAPWGEADPVGSLAAAGGALLSLTGAGLGWKAPDRQNDPRFALLIGTGGALLVLSTWFGFAHWQAPLWIGAIAVGLLLLAARSQDRRIEPLAASFSALGLLALCYTFLPGRENELAALVGVAASQTDGAALLRWAGLAVVFASFAWRAGRDAIRLSAYFVCTFLVYGAAAPLVPVWTLPILLAALGSVQFLVLQRRESSASEAQLLPFATGSVLLLSITGSHPIGEWLRLAGGGTAPADALSALRWIAPAALSVLVAARSRLPILRAISQVAAAALAYGAIAQVLPGVLLPLLPAAGAVALVAVGARLPRLQPHAAAVTLVAISAAWTLEPLVEWIIEAAWSLAGMPMLLDSSDLSTSAVLRRLLGPAVLLGGALWLLRKALPRRALVVSVGLLGALTVVAVHCLYRHAFSSVFGSTFAEYGLGERLAWTALLIVTATTLMKCSTPLLAGLAAPALAGMAAWHVTWYSLLLHNPLWAEQHVGSVPGVNLVLPLFATLPVSLYLLRRMRGDWWVMLDRVMQPVMMVMVAMFGWSTLRQAFHGTVLTSPGLTQFEDILRSILGIVLAVGYLLWGIRAKRHNWRIASLVLMLAAVAKVFLFDASGLEGLWRIASFVALGVSLIGIGWLYSRQLRRETEAPPGGQEAAELFQYATSK